MRLIFRLISSLALASSLMLGAEVLAVVNGKDITTELAPKDFETMEKKTQDKIIQRLIQKRLAADYALSQDVAKTEEFKKALEHVLQMSMKKGDQESMNLADILKDDASIKGYTAEQLYSKKGLLAFDFLLNKKAEELKTDEEALKEFYEMRKYQYDTPAMIELLSIVVDNKELSKEILGKLKSADNKFKTFSNLAEEYSLAPSAKKHGYFGKLPIHELNDTLKPILKDMKRSDYTKEPIKTEFGYQIFYVLNDIPEFESTFEEVRGQVEDAYVKEKIRSWAMAKIKELEEKADIQIKQ